MNTHQLLLIDDDRTLTSLLGDHLRTAGYSIEVANDGEQGLQRVVVQQPDLIVLDVMMPETDGWEVLERLGGRSSCPVIMLTAKDQEFDKLRAFHLGVDDYVTKPFSFAELTARIGAVLARARRQRESPELIVTGDLQIDLVKRRLTRKGSPIDLTPIEFRLLEVLSRNHDVPVPSEALLEQVWGPDYAGEFEHVKHYIWSLRRKLEADPGDPQHLLTERGFGYRLV